MPTVEYVNLDEMLPARALRKESQRLQVRAEYEGYIAGLAPGQAGKLVLDKGDKFSTIRDRLRSAARRLDKRIQIRRKADIVYFRLRDGDEPGD